MILLRFTDVAELRAETDIRGSVPLATGVTLVQSAHMLVRSSSTSSRTERLSIDGHYLRSGDDLAVKARMAHTRDGSYVLPILMPLPRSSEGNEETPALIPNDELFESDERRVTRTLAQTMAVIRSQIVEPARSLNTDALGALLFAGATREAVKAVEHVLRADGVSALETRFAWAAGELAPAFIPSEVSIPSEAAPLLAEAADQMRSRPRPRFEQFTGPIVELRDPQDGRGEAWIRTVRRGRNCEIRVSIDEHTLGAVHQWFQRHELVFVTGRVESGRGRPMRIPDPETFGRVADTQFF